MVYNRPVEPPYKRNIPGDNKRTYNQIIISLFLSINRALSGTQWSIAVELWMCCHLKAWTKLRWLQVSYTMILKCCCAYISIAACLFLSTEKWLSIGVIECSIYTMLNLLNLNISHEIWGNVQRSVWGQLNSCLSKAKMRSDC